MVVNSRARILSVSDLLPNTKVSTIEQIYQHNLILLCKVEGSVSAFAARIERSPAQVSQWTNASMDKKTKKRRVMSRQSARYVEGKIGKPVGWMDHRHTEAEIRGEPAMAGPPAPTGLLFNELTGPEREMLDNWRHMSDTDRDDLAPQIAQRAERFQRDMDKAMKAGGVRLPMQLTRPANGTTPSPSSAEHPQEEHNGQH